MVVIFTFPIQTARSKRKRCYITSAAELSSQNAILEGMDNDQVARELQRNLDASGGSFKRHKHGL